VSKARQAFHSLQVRCFAHKRLGHISHISPPHLPHNSLQVRCFAHKRLGSLLRRGHLCRDERRAVVAEIVGPEQPLRPRGSQGPHAFAVATRQSAGGGLEPYLLRTYPGVGGAEAAEPAGKAKAKGTARAPPGDLARTSAELLPGTCDAQLWQAVEATSAAPAIFPAARIGGDLLVDGGMVANDPTLLALREVS